jgi:hypothetical protein
LTPFFEEASLTVNAAAVDAPYRFERYLFNADTALFGGKPAVMLSQAGNPVLDEIMHAFYFSYYLLIIGGIVIAWNRGRRGRGMPGSEFHTVMTCMILGFFLSYVWYPFLPARGPWEHTPTSWRACVRLTAGCSRASSKRSSRVPRFPEDVSQALTSRERGR